MIKMSFEFTKIYCLHKYKRIIKTMQTPMSVGDDDVVNYTLVKLRYSYMVLLYGIMVHNAKTLRV